MTQNSSNGGEKKEWHSLRERVSRRRFLKAAGVAAAGLAVTPLLEACAPAGGAPAPTTPAAKVTPAAELAGVVAPMAARGELPEQTIVLAMFSGPEADVHKRLSPKWQEYTKGKCKLVVEDIGRGAVGTTKYMTTMMGKSDSWDAIWEYTLRFGGTAPAGFQAPLEPFMADPNLFNAKAYDLEDFPKGVRDLYTYKGKLLAFSQEISTLLLMYRKDMLQKYGVKEPPAQGWTWEELRDVCLVLKDKLKADGKTDVFPLLYGVKLPSHAAMHPQIMLWGNTVEWLDDKTQTPKFSQPGSVDALTFTANLLWKDGLVTAGMVDYEYMEVLTGFQQGKAAICLQWVAAAPTLNSKEQSPETAGKVGYRMYPVFKKKPADYNAGYSHGHGVAVSSYSKKQKAAFEYITWFTSKENARDYVVNGGGTSGRVSVLSDPAIQKAAGEHLQAHLETMKVSHRGYDNPELLWVRDSGLGPNMSAMWTKQKTIDQALKDSDKDITNYFKEKGLIK